MRFSEVNILGVYVAPILLVLFASWIISIALHRVANRCGLLRLVWHRALFDFAVYIVVLSSIVLVMAP
jgi:hypothetical protein